MCECTPSPAFICYCGAVTETMIADAIRLSHAKSVEEVIQLTGAMRHCDCAANNPKGVCCYPDIVSTCAKHGLTRIK